MSADKDRAIRRQKQKRAKDKKKDSKTFRSADAAGTVAKSGAAKTAAA